MYSSGNRLLLQLYKECPICASKNPQERDSVYLNVSWRKDVIWLSPVFASPPPACEGYSSRWCTSLGASPLEWPRMPCTTHTQNVSQYQCQWEKMATGIKLDQKSQYELRKCNAEIRVGVRSWAASLAYLFQSRTSEKGRMYESARMTGTQPACSTSLSVACPSRAPRSTTQNDDSWGTQITTRYYNIIAISTVHGFMT